jgi:hypothetical protein
MKTDAIKAGKHFQIDRWPRLKYAALRLAMAEMQVSAPYRDKGKIHKLSQRFGIGSALAFYAGNPELFWGRGAA